MISKSDLIEFLQGVALMLILIIDYILLWAMH